MTMRLAILAGFFTAVFAALASAQASERTEEQAVESLAKLRAKINGANGPCYVIAENVNLAKLGSYPFCPS